MLDLVQEDAEAAIPNADDATGGNDNAHVRGQRADFVYNEYNDFTTPVIISGTNRVFRQSTALSVIAKPSLAALDDLIDSCRQIDTHLRLLRLPSVAAIKLDVVTPDIITFRVEGHEKVFYFETPITKTNPLAFKRFSSLLGVPYAYAKKSPTFLNKVNFDYYLRLALMAQKENPLPIDLVFDHEPREISYAIPLEDQDDADKAEVTATVVAYRVSNVLKGERKRGRIASEDAPEEVDDTPPIATRIPFFSDILAGVKNQIHEVSPDINPLLQTYASGYDDRNKGRHFARIIFDSPATNFTLNKEVYQLGLNIETDFSGDAKDFGEVGFSFILFRQICTNGMMAVGSVTDQARFRDAYVSEQLEAAGFTLKDAEEGGVEAALALRQQAEARFHIIFSEGCLKISVAQANAGLDISNFTLGLKFFLESKTLQQARLATLQEEFGTIEEEDFVKTVLSLQASMKLASPELMKFFLIEYAAGQITGKQPFKTPFDVLNFLTLLSRAYETAVIADIERKAFGFASQLYSQLVHKRADKEVSLADQYRGMVNQTLLEGVAA